MDKSNLLPGATKDRLFQTAVVLIIGLGIALRAAKYLPAWSLRSDELSVALNVFDRSAKELMTKSLEYEQAAPMGFLLLEKMLVVLFGQSEYILRLPAFLSGCLSLVLMQTLLAKIVGKYGNLFALSALVLGWYPIYYASELKQYSSDILICIILLLLLHKHLSSNTTVKDFLELGFIGVLSLFFSHPAIFILIAIGVSLFLYYWQNRRKLFWISAIGMIWSLVFLAIYLLLLRYQTTSEYLIAFWDGLLSFMPMPPWRDLSWFPKAIGGLLFIGGLSSGLILSAALYTLGLWAYFSEEKWLWIITLTIPFALNLGVSGFKKFPFHGRLILYLLPLLFITLGKGIDEIVKIIKNRTLANVIFAGLMVLLLHPAIPTATDFLFTQKYLTDDLKPVLAYMQENARSDDLIYLYHHASQKFIYYAPDYNLEKLSRIDGDDRSRNAAKYQHDLSLLPRGQRIWFVFSSVSDTKVENTKQDERTYILEYLNEHGTILKDYFATNDASSAHLYMLDK